VGGNDQSHIIKGNVAMKTEAFCLSYHFARLTTSLSDLVTSRRARTHAALLYVAEDGNPEFLGPIPEEAAAQRIAR
jgi:hypothetical protein